MKKTMCFILSFVLLLSCISTITFAASAAPEKLEIAGNYVLADQNANVALYVDSNTGDFAIMNQKSNAVWYSNPLDWESDQIAQGDSYTDLTSKMTVQYITSSYITGSVNSNQAAVIAERSGKDWIITFYFKKANTNFSIPVKLSLKDEYVHVELMIDQIQEKGDTRILSVNLYPYFGAAGLNDTGYGFIPDGTGSLMEFNRELLNNYMFGNDKEGLMFAPNPTEVSTNSYFQNWNEELRLPVYGMVKNNDAFLAIIESGAAVTEIQANMSRLWNSYNVVKTCVNIRDVQARKTATGDKGEGSYYSEIRPENYIVRYYPLDTEDASYIGMAERYRKYLIEEKGMTPVKDVASNALNISLYGAVKKQKHFLGIPYTGAEYLTTYSEAEALVDRLVDDKVDKVFIDYSGWSTSGLDTTTPLTLKPSSKLGGKKAIKSLIAKVNEIDNYTLAFDLELHEFHSQTSEIKKFKDVSHGLDASPAVIWRGRISAAGAAVKSNMGYMLIHPARMLGYAEKFINSGSTYDLKSYSFNSLGDTLYCAYNLNDDSTRDKSEHHMIEIFNRANEAIGEDGILNTTGGNAYAAPYVDNIIDAPVYASHNILLSKEVPFYQIVFRGYVNMASNPINLESEQDDLILKLAETGMSLYYQFIDAESTAFHNTDYTQLYACELDDHYDDMIATYNRMKPLYDAVGESTIVNYEVISDDVKITTFSNGSKVYVNYSDAEVNVNGVKVAAKDFTVVGGVAA
mgnify:CR=1 FL=1